MIIFMVMVINMIMGECALQAVAKQQLNVCREHMQL
jgi:hypothetical protein